jgi:hypothetical protein
VVNAVAEDVGPAVAGEKEKGEHGSWVVGWWEASLPMNQH